MQRERGSRAQNPVQSTSRLSYCPIPTFPAGLGPTPSHLDSCSRHLAGLPAPVWSSSPHSISSHPFTHLTIHAFVHSSNTPEGQSLCHVELCGWSFPTWLTLLLFSGFLGSPDIRCLDCKFLENVLTRYKSGILRSHSLGTNPSYTFSSQIIP